MSYLLYTGQIIDALSKSDHPKWDEFESRLRALNDEAARALAAHLQIDTVPDQGAMEQESFAAVFGPAFEGQPMPDVLEGYDAASEWGE